MVELPGDIRAVLFDIYGTLLDGPRHADRNQRVAAVAERFGLKPRIDLEVAFDLAVARAHRVSPDPYPEVDVREIWLEIFPGLTGPDAFALEVEDAIHPVTILETGHTLFREAVERGLPVGIVSNAQAYTRELMSRHFPDLWAHVRPDLLAFSYEHRISKPDARLFEKALAPLINEDISIGDVLMIGDSMEKDITPARSLGLRALHLGV